MRILICDDDLEMSMQLKEILQCFFSTSSLNIPEITIYNNGTDLLLDSGEKDIVFLDIELPDVSGIYVGNELKKTNSNTIIFIVTSYSQYLDDAILSVHIGRYNGKYYAFHRPSSPELGGNYIWLAESPDRKHWGNHKCVATTREGKWDSARVGAGAPPIRTERGWLEIYHGATHDHRYCLGALLLDLNDPSKVISRSEEPIMEPIADYEQTGFFGNVVFTNGHYVDGDTVHLYYGASDEVICAATLSVKEILNTLK